MRRFIAIALLAIAVLAVAWPARSQAPPPVPALPDVERRTAYQISNSNCACAVGFDIYGDSTDYGAWLEVWVNGVEVPPSAWTVTSTTGPLASIPRPIGNAIVTFLEPQTGLVQIIGARRPRRPSVFADNAPVTARALNQVINDIVAMERERWDERHRYIRVPPGETTAPLPPASDRAGLVICFDAMGVLTVCTPGGGPVVPPDPTPSPTPLYPSLISGYGAF